MSMSGGFFFFVKALLLFCMFIRLVANRITYLQNILKRDKLIYLLHTYRAYYFVNFQHILYTFKNIDC